VAVYVRMGHVPLGIAVLDNITLGYLVETVATSPTTTLIIAVRVITVVRQQIAIVTMASVSHAILVPDGGFVLITMGVVTMSVGT
jgi:hypothetical protein